MKKITKRNILNLITILIILCLLMGCSSKTNSPNYVASSSQEYYSSLLEEATTVKIKEKFISFKKEYDIYVAGERIGTVSGKYVNITGDVFTFTDANGNEIAKEKQIKRWGIKLNRLARLMDTEGNITGYIGEEFFTDFLSLSKYNFHIYDEERNELGYTKERILSLFYEFNVYDVSDEILFKISKKLDIVDSYEIVKQKESDISMIDVVFLTCIIDAIEDSTEEKDDNKN